MAPSVKKKLDSVLKHVPIFWEKNGPFGSLGDVYIYVCQYCCKVWSTGDLLLDKSGMTVKYVKYLCETQHHPGCDWRFLEALKKA